MEIDFNNTVEITHFGYYKTDDSSRVILWIFFYHNLFTKAEVKIFENKFNKSVYFYVKIILK